jgi:hypothetical protein
VKQEQFSRERRVGEGEGFGRVRNRMESTKNEKIRK